MAASCSVGTINLKTSPFHCGTGRSTGVSPLNSFRPLTGKKPIEPQSLRIPHKKPWKVSSTSSTTSLETLKHYDEVPKESGLTSELIPNFDEVESLLTTICDTTSIVEVNLKVSGFELHVTRSFDAKLSASPAPPSAVPISSQTVVESPDLNGSVSAPTLAIIAKPEISSRNIQTLVDNAADEGLVIIRSPKVGFFRRSRTIKGKRAPPPCKEKQTVKEGQVVCYVEQLGGELPIESDVSGEVIKILREDGEPVGYNDPLIAILPSFPGIKKLQ